MAVNMRLRRGDSVRVISGRDKGTEGEIIRVLPKKGQVVVQGVNLRKKHQKQVQAGGRTMNPGIIQFEGPLNVSNVMLICPKCHQPTRVGIRREDGERRRVCKQCDADLD